MVDTRKLHRKMPRLIVQEPSTPFMYILLYNFDRARKFLSSVARNFTCFNEKMFLYASFGAIQ